MKRKWEEEEWRENGMYFITNYLVALQKRETFGTSRKIMHMENCSAYRRNKIFKIQPSFMKKKIIYERKLLWINTQ